MNSSIFAFLFNLCESYKGVQRRYTLPSFYARLFDDFFILRPLQIYTTS